METTPIGIDGVVYDTTAFDRVHALDARTAEQLRHPEQKSGRITVCRRGPNDRGVAAYGHTVQVGELDAERVALDANTGKLPWTFPTVPEDSAGVRATPMSATVRRSGAPGPRKKRGARRDGRSLRDARG